MKSISIADVTLAAPPAAPQPALSFKEKLETARHLQNLRTDVVELAGVENEKTDALLIRTVAAFVKEAVLSVDAGRSEDGVETVWHALSGAARPRLRVELPLSPVQMEYMCHKKEAGMLALITSLVSRCAALCPEVEFRALDAVRAETAFLDKALAAAAEAGATLVTVCDNEGLLLPAEFGAFIARLRQTLPDTRLGVLCSDSYGLSLACCLTAVKAGADEVKVCAGERGVAPMDGAARLLSNSESLSEFQLGLKMTELTRTVRQIRWLTSTKKSEGTPFDSGVSDPAAQTAELARNESPDAVAQAVQKLGYDLSPEDGEKVYEEYRRTAEKKAVTLRELDAIVASVALQVPPTYKLLSYVINSSNITGASAHLKLEKNGRELSGICLGDGPVDAAFLAIEQIVGRHYELDDFQIQAVTEGREAMGCALVKLRGAQRLYSGNGISTDIIGATIAAYLSALNKITYEEA